MEDKALKENDRILLKMFHMGYKPLKMKNNKILMVRGSHRHNKNNSSIHLICQLCSPHRAIQFNNFIHIAD